MQILPSQLLIGRLVCKMGLGIACLMFAQVRLTPLHPPCCWWSFLTALWTVSLSTLASKLSDYYAVVIRKILLLSVSWRLDYKCLVRDRVPTQWFCSIACWGQGLNWSFRGLLYPLSLKFVRGQHCNPFHLVGIRPAYLMIGLSYNFWLLSFGWVS